MLSKHTPTQPGHHSHRRNRQVRTIVVCLPPYEGPRPLPELAATTLHKYGMTVIGPIPHFLARPRRTKELVDRWHGMTSGGPIRLLDLDAMRRNAAAAAAAQWQLWYQTTAGTRPAQPFWIFTDRHRGDPRRYSLQRAKADYLAQPRVVAMNAYNALPHRACELPTGALEAFQAGQSTYLNLGWLAAAPGDGLASADGASVLTPTSGRLADQLAYLHAANSHIDGANPNFQLVAMAIPAYAARTASAATTAPAASTTEGPA